jgi:cytochrome b subunit of formate dehydrogenase
MTRRGYAALKAILPRRSDLQQVAENLLFHLWRRRQPAAFARYDYTQKVEYWALIWGTALMAITGLVLWFPEQAVRIVPSWAVTAAQSVHFYEAWLATLAVIVWHLFFVVFHPSVYPMSWTWLTGRMGRDEAREHHPDWYREMMAKSAPTTHRDDQAPPPKKDS